MDEVESLSPGRVPLLGERLAESVARLGERPALRYRIGGVWRDISWKQLGDDVRAAAQALVDFGVGEGDRVAIWSSNRPEWTMVDLACTLIRAVSVPLHSTASASQAGYILAEAEAKVVFVGGREQVAKLSALRPFLPALTQVVAFETGIDGGAAAPLGFPGFLEAGRTSASGPEVERRLSRASADDLLTLIYTSGTTGEPKGVMLAHGSFALTIGYHDLRLPAAREGDVSLCFLPLAHVFERAWTAYALLGRGMTVAYCDEPAKVVEFLAEVRPMVMCAVPRFYEKVYATVLDRLESASPLRRRLFRWALAVGADHARRSRQGKAIPAWLAWEHAVADRLVLGKIRAILGGRVRFLPSAGAPLSVEIEEFFHAAGIFIVEGYGLTETTATVTCHETTGFRPGTVGKPLSGVEVKVSAEGEILVRGATVMKGYYRKPRETAEVLVDGWLRTGDAGVLESDGNLRITERIKDLIKTSGGKYVAPQQIESTIGADHYVEQIAVIGEGRRFVTALIVPAFEALEKWARAVPIPFTGREVLLQDERVVNFYRERISDRSRDLAPFEKIIRFTLLLEPFSIDRGEMTPTMKVRRRAAAERYRDAIDRMYAES